MMSGSGNSRESANQPETGQGCAIRTNMKCTYCGMKSQKSAEVSFHRFPKDSELSNKWATVLGLQYVVAASPATRYTKFRICSQHFHQSDYVGRKLKRLRRDAVPMINESSMYVDVNSVKKSLQESLCARSVNDMTMSMNDGISSMDDSMGDGGNITTYIQEGLCASSVNGSMDDGFRMMTKTEEFITSTPRAKRSAPDVTPKTRKIRSLSTKLYYLKQKCKKNVACNRVKSVLDAIKGLPNISPVIHNFIACQLRASCVSKYGRRWGVKDKNLALQLYLASPKAYRSLREFFALPTKKTLMKSLSGIEMSPGFSDAVLNAMKLVASKMKSHDKYCIVSFDEMKLKSALSYNSKCDIIVGYENYGTYEVSNPRLATHALVFMVRGLCKKWKQVFGFFFSCESASSSVLKHLVNEGLAKLIACGLVPIAIVCDQGANNQRLYDKELKVSADEPYFFVQGHKIYSLFDAPHLLKCVRNNFKRYPVKYVNENMCKIALWEHVVAVWEFESKLTAHRFAPKLTRRHVEVDGLSAMNVRLAAQVLSHSVASAITYLSLLNGLPRTASQTTDFCGIFNDLFDSVNSRMLRHSVKPLLSAVKQSSPHLESWKQFSEVIQTIEFQTQGKKIKFPCIQGWLTTLSAFRKMIPELLVNVPNIMMSRFTQDSLENFFALVRNKGGNNDHPTSSDFQNRIRMLMAQHIINTCGHANCEPDDDTVLVPVKVLTESATVGNEKSSLSDIFPREDTFPMNSNNAEQNESENIFSDELEILHCENSAAYVAGYIAKLCVKKFMCETCKYLLLTEKKLTKSTIFLYIKEFDGVKDGLCFPTNSWLLTVCEFGRRFSNMFSQVCTNKYVSKKIVNNLYEVNHDWFSCTSHETVAWEYMLCLYVKMMLYYKVKFESKAFVDRKKAAKKN